MAQRCKQRQCRPGCTCVLRAGGPMKRAGPLTMCLAKMGPCKRWDWPLITQWPPHSLSVLTQAACEMLLKCDVPHSSCFWKKLYFRLAETSTRRPKQSSDGCKKEKKKKRCNSLMRGCVDVPPGSRGGVVCLRWWGVGLVGVAGDGVRQGGTLLPRSPSNLLSLRSLGGRQGARSVTAAQKGLIRSDLSARRVCCLRHRGRSWQSQKEAAHRAVELGRVLVKEQGKGKRIVFLG